MNYKVHDNEIILYQPDLILTKLSTAVRHFDGKKCQSEYDCTYSGYFLDRPLTISHDGDRFILHNTSEEDFLNVWADYFDLSTDYGAVKIRLSADETLRKACEFAGGIRLLKQDKWECLCSFIISQNNNIPRIKGIISGCACITVISRRPPSLRQKRLKASASCGQDFVLNTLSTRRKKRRTAPLSLRRYLI